MRQKYHNQLLPQQHNCIRQYQHGSDVKLKLHSRQAISSKMVYKLLVKSNKSAWGLKVGYCWVAFDLHDKRSRTYFIMETELGKIECQCSGHL